jgi:hypothetical protein
LHAKAKAEPGYCFYALHDKISREDILAHAYAQCRSNKGAPGVDRQDFEAVEAYGVERWLGELALALRQDRWSTKGILLRPVEPAAAEKVFVWLDGSLADCLVALQRSGEDHSDVILQLAAVENEDAWHARSDRNGIFLHRH